VKESVVRRGSAVTAQQLDRLQVGAARRLQPHALELRGDVLRRQLPAPGAGGAALQQVVREEAHVGADAVPLDGRQRGLEPRRLGDAAGRRAAPPAPPAHAERGPDGERGGRGARAGARGGSSNGS
jgi:hypothetical protein